MQTVEKKSQSKECFYDDSFLNSDTENLVLLLEAGSGFLNVAVCNHTVNTFPAIEKFRFPGQKGISNLVSCFESAKSESMILKHEKFRKIICASHFGNPQLVPFSLFSKECEKDFYEFANEGSDEVIMTDNLPLLNAMHVFALPELVFKMFRYWYPAAGFHHSGTAFINACLHEVKNTEGNSAFLNFNPLAFDIAIFKKDKLILKNTFEFQSPEDVLYYVLFVLEQLEISSQHISLKLSGDVYAGSENCSLLKKYFEKINFVSPPENRNLVLPKGDLAFYQHFALLNLYQCAL